MADWTEPGISLFAVWISGPGIYYYCRWRAVFMIARNGSINSILFELLRFYFRVEEWLLLCPIMAFNYHNQSPLVPARKKAPSSGQNFPDSFADRGSLRGGEGEVKNRRARWWMEKLIDENWPIGVSNFGEIAIQHHLHCPSRSPPLSPYHSFLTRRTGESINKL